MPQGRRFLCKAARLAVGPASPPSQYTPLDIRRRQSGRNVKLTSRLHLDASLRLRGAIPPLTYMPLYMVHKLITDTTLQSPRRSVNGKTTLDLGATWN